MEKKGTAARSGQVQQHKIDSVGALKELFSDGSDFIFSDYRGLTVEQITRLRRRLKEEGGSYRVVRNRFARLALEELKVPDLGDNLIGPTAVTTATGESGHLAKILFEFAREMPVEVKGGYVGGSVFGPAEIEAYSKLPTRNEIIAQLMSVMNGPVRQFVYLLNEIPTSFVRTLKAVADAKEDGSS